MAEQRVSAPPQCPLCGSRYREGRSVVKVLTSNPPQFVLCDHSWHNDVETVSDGREQDVIQGGMDSAFWLLNNPYAHDTADWPRLTRAAREDRDAALAALSQLVEDRNALRIEVRVAQDGWMVAAARADTLWEAFEAARELVHAHHFIPGLSPASLEGCDHPECRDLRELA